MTTPAPTSKPEAKEDDSLAKKLPPLHVAAQVASTLACALVASFFGTTGTLVGLGLGSALSTTLPTLIEHLGNRTSARVREKVKRYRMRGLSPEQAQLLAEADVKHEDRLRETGMLPRVPRRKPRALAWAAATSAVAVLVCCGVLYGVEAAAGKPVSYVVTNKPGHGTTFSGGSTDSTSTEPAGQPPSPSPSSSPAATLKTEPALATPPASDNTETSTGTPTATVIPETNTAAPPAPGASTSETAPASPAGTGTVAPVTPAPTGTAPGMTPSEAPTGQPTEGTAP